MANYNSDDETEQLIPINGQNHFDLRRELNDRRHSLLSDLTFNPLNTNDCQNINESNNDTYVQKKYVENENKPLGSYTKFETKKNHAILENEALMLCQQYSRNIEINLIQKQRKRRWRFRLFSYILLYGCFLVIGSLCFQAIESPAEKEAKDIIRKTKDHFLLKYPNILDEDLEEFLAVIIKANDRGISPLRNSSSDQNWAFGQALFFSSTVVTTIGYGHVTPLSQTGKIFCMIYATIGIPLTLVLLSAVVERLLIPANWLLGSLNSKLGHLYQPFNIRLLHLSIIVALVSVLFFAIPTAVFAYLEPSWGILDAFYYCFISLTTIGLGDYIPGEGVSIENGSLYKICITCYLILGLIAMMLALTVFYDIPQLNLGQLFTENQTGESEKLRLSGNSAPCYSGPSGLYIPQRDEDTHRVVRIKPHGDDSPSPDEQPSTMHRDIRVP